MGDKAKSCLTLTLFFFKSTIYNRKGKRKRKRKNKLIYANKIATLLYSTFERVPVIFYHTNLYWNGCASMDNYSCLLDGPLCNSCIWRHEDMAHLLWWLFNLLFCFLYNTMLSLYDVWWCKLHSIWYIWRYETNSLVSNGPISSSSCTVGYLGSYWYLGQ